MPDRVRVSVITIAILLHGTMRDLLPAQLPVVAIPTGGLSTHPVDADTAVSVRWKLLSVRLARQRLMLAVTGRSGAASASAIAVRRDSVIATLLDDNQVSGRLGTPLS